MFAIDYDGTVADTNWVKAKWIQENLGEDVAPYNCDRTNCVRLIGPNPYKKMSEEIYVRDVSLRTNPVSGAPQALRTLAERGPVYILTARKSSLPFAEEWLEKNNLAQYIRKCISVENPPKIRVAEALGCRVLIDDDERHLAAIPETGLLRIHLRIGLERKEEPEGPIRVCTTWPEAVAQATQQT